MFINNLNDRVLFLIYNLKHIFLLVDFWKIFLYVSYNLSFMMFLWKHLLNPSKVIMLKWRRKAITAGYLLRVQIINSSTSHLCPYWLGQFAMRRTEHNTQAGRAQSNCLSKNDIRRLSLNSVCNWRTQICIDAIFRPHTALDWVIKLFCHKVY